MSKVKTLYQTIRNEGSPDFIEKNGPFGCKWENAWLGNGYYFWDTFINLAHWWGSQPRFKPNGYIICQAKCTFDTERCFDLIEPETIEIFNTFIDRIKEANIIDIDSLTVSKVIAFLKKHTPFNYEAIRVSGHFSVINDKYRYKLNFETNKPQYLDLLPPYQICIFKQDGLDLRDYKIVYPDDLVE